MFETAERGQMAGNVVRSLSALVCLLATYGAANTSFDPVWVSAAALSAFVLGTGRRHWDQSSEPSAALPWPDARQATALLFPGWALMGIAGVSTALGAPGLVVDGVWCLGGLLLLGGTWKLSSELKDTASDGRGPRVWILGLAVLALAAVSRLWALGTVPRYVHLDEGVMTLNAMLVYDDLRPGLFAPGPAEAYGLMRIYFYLIGIGNAVLGFDLYGTRISDAVLGILSVLLLFDGVRRLSNLRTATVAAALLAANHCHVAFSRIGAGYVQPAFVVALGIALLGRLWTRPTYFASALLGIAMALGIQTYQASFAAVPLLLLVWLLLLVFHPNRRPGLLPAAVLFTVSLVTAAAPFAAVTWQRLDALTSRSRQLAVFGNEERLARLKAEVFQTDSTTVVATRLVWDALRSFHHGRDHSEQYGAAVPMADRYTAALMIPGAVLAVLAITRPLGAASVVFTVGYLLLSFVLVWPPGFQRATGVLPLAMALPAIALVQIFGALWVARSNWSRRARDCSLIVATALCVVAGLRVYFVDHPASRLRGDPASEAGWAARHYASQYDVHLVSWPIGKPRPGQPPPGWEGLQLIVGNTRVPKHTQRDPVAYVNGVTVREPAVFIIWERDRAAHDALLAKFPNARSEFWRPEVLGRSLHLVFVPPSVPETR